MPRPTRGVALEKRTIQLPKALWDAIDELNFDPVRKKPRYGAATKFFERLVRQELNARGKILTLTEQDDDN